MQLSQGLQNSIAESVSMLTADCLVVQSALLIWSLALFAICMAVQALPTGLSAYTQSKIVCVQHACIMICNGSCSAIICLREPKLNLEQA